jgi:hypothetical protein
MSLHTIRGLSMTSAHPIKLNIPTESTSIGDTINSGQLILEQLRARQLCGGTLEYVLPGARV